MHRNGYSCEDAEDRIDDLQQQLTQARAELERARQAPHSVLKERAEQAERERDEAQERIVKLTRVLAERDERLAQLSALLAPKVEG